MNTKLVTLTLLSTLAMPALASSAGPGNNKMAKCVQAVKTKFEAMSLLKDMQDAEDKLSSKIDVRVNPDRYDRKDLDARIEKNRQEIEAVKESLAQLNQEKRDAKKSQGLFRAATLDNIDKKINLIVKKTASLQSVRNDLSKRKIALNISESTDFETTRVTNVYVSALEGDELAAFYKKNPEHKNFDEKNNYVRVYVSRSYTFDSISEQDLANGELVNPGVHLDDTHVLIDNNELDQCKIRQIVKFEHDELK